MYELFHLVHQLSVGMGADQFPLPLTIRKDPNGCAELAIIVVGVGCGKAISDKGIKGVTSALRCTACTHY